MAGIRTPRSLQQTVLSRYISFQVRLTGSEALEQHTANLTISTDQEKKLSKDLAKKEAKQAAKQSKLEAEKAASKVIIKRIERGKRKYVTAIANLQTFDVDIKKAAKMLANKFARGASVSKTVEGKEEIVVQGDLVDEIEEFILEQYKVSEDQIAMKEEKGPKKG
jgi:density-regulated protein